MLSLQEFKGILDCVGHSLFIQDEQYRFVYVNEEICEESGIPRDQWAGRTEYDLFPREQADVFRRNNIRVFETGEKMTNEELTTDANGNVKTLLTTKTLYRDHTGAKYVVGILRDITIRKKIEEALYTNELRITQAMDLASVVYWESDIEGVFTFNDHFYAFYGTTADREGGYKMTREEYEERFIHPEDRVHVSRVRKANQKLAVSEAVPDLELRIIRRDGEIRHILVRETLARNSSGGLIKKYGVNLDITKRKLAQQEREKLISKLQTTLAKVRTLSGLIPICSSCKKVRHDEGYWEQVEEYVRKHSQAEFTHGICPECMERLYPELIDS